MLSKILKKLQINTMRTKLVMAFIFVGLVPFLVFAVFSYNIYSGAFHNKITNYSKEVVFRLKRQLDTYVKDIALLLDMKDDYYINQCINLVQAGEFSGNRKYIFRLWEDFHNICNLKSGLKELSLTFPDGQRLSNYGIYYLQKKRQNHFNNIKKSEKDFVVTEPHFDFYDQPVISVARLFNDQKIGSDVIISADIDLQVLKDLTDVRLGKNGYMFIVDKKGKVIYHPREKKIGEESQFYIKELQNKTSGNVLYNKKGRDYILTFATSRVTGWKIISVAYASQITAELNKLKHLTFVWLVIIIASVVLLIVYISAFLTKPIRKLERVTKMAADNNLDVNIETRGNDEIAKLGQSFNKMLKRIKNLIRENIAEQKQIRNLEMKSLHEQIKPHFIYNTLDLIIGHLEKENNDGKASYLLESLGRFFRLSFAQGKEMVSIREELSHIKSYLQIQQQRFGDQFEFFIEVKDGQIYDYYLPKLLLQPLVENAIYHGVLESEKKGLIIIKAYFKDDNLIIEIIDNGSGIDKERLRDINNILEQGEMMKDENKYFGLKNVNMRIKYKFGFEYGLEIESKPGDKTVSRLKIGIIKKGDKND